MMENLLESIVREEARFAILDLTGVAAMDTSTVHHILRIFGAARTLGVEGVLSGVQPAVAQTVVSLGIDLDALRMVRTLHDALAWCLRDRTDGGREARPLAVAPGAGGARPRRTQAVEERGLDPGPRDAHHRPVTHRPASRRSTCPTAAAPVSSWSGRWARPTRGTAWPSGSGASPARLPAVPHGAARRVGATGRPPAPTVTSSQPPPLLYDYSGFPPSTYQLKWPAPGSPELAARVQQLLGAPDRRAGRREARLRPRRLHPAEGRVSGASHPDRPALARAGLDPAEHLAIGRALWRRSATKGSSSWGAG